MVNRIRARATEKGPICRKLPTQVEDYEDLDKTIAKSKHFYHFEEKRTRSRNASAQEKHENATLECSI